MQLDPYDRLMVKWALERISNGSNPTKEIEEMKANGYNSAAKEIEKRTKP